MSTHIRPNKPLAIALAGFLILVVLTWTHRALTFPVFLPGAAGEGVEAVLKPFFVGALSDLWVAYLLSILTWIIAIVGGKAGAYVWLGVLALLTAGHQAYVEFFRFQIVPAHLVYLADVDFLSANAGSAFSLRGLLIFAAFCAMIWAQNRIQFTTTLSAGRRAEWLFGLLLPLCLFAHHKNIMLRENWFIPEPLRTEALENLVMRWQHYTPPARLSADEVRELAADVASDDLRPFSLLARPAASADPLAIALRAAYAGSRSGGKKPVLAVVLLESMRPSETGYFDKSKPSLTPRLDELAARAVVFDHTFSTGSVTRGGQEAVLCGYLGTRDASLMRSNSLATIRCIPDELAARDPRAGFFWYHGGEGRFDGQLRFWTERKAKDALSLKDFKEDAARSGWGVGDETFFPRAHEKLIQLRQDPAFDHVAGLFLSVSNHIPWDLPADAPPEISALRGQGAHPSYVTTRYADDALGRFVAQTKAEGLWDDLLLLVLSDHGNDVPPYANLYPNERTRAAQLQSHVNFLVAGGLLEKAAKAAGQDLPRTDARVHGQADAAALAAFVLGLDTPFMGEVPLGGTRHLPVISELEEWLWVPEAGIATPRADAASAAAHADEPKAMRTARLYYRLFLDFITRK